MTTANICRRILDSALPDGSIWVVKPNDALDQFYHGTAANFEELREMAAAVQWLRTALQTDELADLEIEFGVIPDENLSSAERRAYLRALMGERCVLPSLANLEAKLRAAGFNVRCYANDPPMEPEPIITATGGYYLVNGDVYNYQERDYDVTCCDTATDDGECTVCDDDGTEDIADRGDTVGSFVGMIRSPYDYEHPTRYRWPFIFWIAEDIAGNEAFVDWRMEYATVTEWTAGGGGDLSKSLAWKTNGIRSLEVMAVAGWSDPIGPYAEQLLDDVITGSRIVTVDAMSYDKFGGTTAGLCICDKDGVWDTAGIVYSASGSAGETLTYTAANGVSGVRLYLADGTTPVDIGWYSRFDNLQIDYDGSKEAYFLVADIDQKWRAKFEKLVLRYKPVHCWAGVLVNWTTPTPTPGPFEEDDA
jgi:hypothetical protein